ncbi:MAG: pseudaminic acid biosynthesis-associated methylase [Pseudomonadota bacterium]
MTQFKTEQEAFWAGEFGNEYIGRNGEEVFLQTDVAFFSTVLRSIGRIESCIEFGCNIGLNLRALNSLDPRMSQHAVEINAQAAEQARQALPDLDLHHGSILEYESSVACDLSISKGVLIHISPDELNKFYDRLYKHSSRYILVAEYYNPKPVAIPYRGHKDKLFKRDFAGEMMDRFSDLELHDYGFVYHRDPMFPQDDMNWFILRKA